MRRAYLIEDALYYDLPAAILEPRETARWLGCIGCPMTGKREREREFARWPKYQDQWIRAFQRMVDKRNADGLPTDWTDGKQVFDFWLEDKR